MSERIETNSTECRDRAGRTATAQLYHALRAPWLALFNPSGAAAVMVRSPLLAVIVSFALHTAILACAIVGIALWSETLNMTSITATSRSGSLIVEFDTIQQVWHKWHRDGLVGLAEQIFIGVCLAVPALACICAWTHMPSVHKSGSAFRSFHRAFCSVAACIVILLFASLAVGALIPLSKTAPWFIPLGICVVVWTVGRAVRGVAQNDDGPSLNPRCESCGYDLTHVARDNRCP